MNQVSIGKVNLDGSYFGGEDGDAEETEDGPNGAAEGLHAYLEYNDTIGDTDGDDDKEPEPTKY